MLTIGNIFRKSLDVTNTSILDYNYRQGILVIGPIILCLDHFLCATILQQNIMVNIILVLKYNYKDFSFFRECTYYEKYLKHTLKFRIFVVFSQ